MGDENLVKGHITFDQTDPRYAGGFGGESLWIEPVHETRGPNIFMVRNEPFFAYDVAFGDFVRVGPFEDYDNEILEVVANGGRGQVRAMLTEEANIETLCKAIEERFVGAGIEGGFGVLLSVSVAQADVEALVDFLDNDPGVNAVEIGKA